MKQLAFLIISSTPSMIKIAQISSHSFWSNQFIFSILCFSTLGSAKKKHEFVGGEREREMHITLPN
jgi:hypothetical protein